jgi:hypothetical protein
VAWANLTFRLQRLVRLAEAVLLTELQHDLDHAARVPPHPQLCVGWHLISPRPSQPPSPAHRGHHTAQQRWALPLPSDSPQRAAAQHVSSGRDTLSLTRTYEGSVPSLFRSPVQALPAWGCLRVWAGAQAIRGEGEGVKSGDGHTPVPRSEDSWLPLSAASGHCRDRLHSGAHQTCAACREH